MISLTKVTELIQHVPHSEHCENLTVSLGDTVYYPMWWGCLVVEARIEELQFVLSHPRYEKNPIWLYLDPTYHGPKGYLCLASKIPKEKNKLGWTVQEEIDDPEEILTDSETVLNSWGAWLDLPIGHAVWPDLDLFLDPSIPLRFIRPRKFRKRRRKSVLNRFIFRGKRSLAVNHKKTIDEMNFPSYRTFKDRRVYWRRK